MSNPKIKLKVGDKVKIIAGRYSGGKRKLKKGEKKEKTQPLIGQISQINLQKQVVYLKKASRKKYDKSTPDSKKKSELKEIMMPIPISNVAYYSEEKKQITKIGWQTREIKKENQNELVKVRVSRKFKDKQGNNLLVD